MKINLITIGTNMPAWVTTAYQEYAKRLPKDYALNLIELKLDTRTKNTNIDQAVGKEGVQLQKAIPQNNHVIALDVLGKAIDTHTLSTSLRDWHDTATDISLLVGGPDGLSKACVAYAHERWSLSALTFPHPLVRVIIAEQIYRAWTLLANHPYHR